MAALDYNYLLSENQMKAVTHFNRVLKKECPGCIVTNLQSVNEQGVEVLVQCSNTKYLDDICELSIEIGDLYDMVIVPTPI